MNFWNNKYFKDTGNVYSPPITLEITDGFYELLISFC